MGRKRSFDESQILKACVATFIRNGYEGTSLDDLVIATGLLRGSLYSAFGSKRGIFLAALQSSIASHPGSTETTDMMLVALLELAQKDTQIRELIIRTFGQTSLDSIAGSLGRRLLERAGVIDLVKVSNKQTQKEQS